jgi:predicted ABC-type ATPase
MKIFTVIGGVNGVGKSSFIGAVADIKDFGVVINVDKIAKDEGLSNIQAGKIALQRINTLIDLGADLTQETTLANNSIINNIEKAKKNGYFIRLIYIYLSSIDEAKQRIAARVKHGGHDISAEDVERRWAKQDEALSNVVPLCDEVKYFNNDNGFMKTDTAELK